MTGLGLGCLLCGRQCAAAAAVCVRCRLDLSPTKLSLFVDCIGLSLDELGELAGLSRSTVKRAIAGEPVGSRSAARLSRVTHIDARHFVEGEPTPPALRGGQ